jgi:hypothetical protein
MLNQTDRPKSRRVTVRCRFTGKNVDQPINGAKDASKVGCSAAVSRERGWPAAAAGIPLIEAMAVRFEM